MLNYLRCAYRHGRGWAAGDGADPVGRFLAGGSNASRETDTARDRTSEAKPLRLGLRH